jgi:hypothetical protein
MLGMYSVLPLLKGWEWRSYQGTRTVTKGETVEVSRVNETGLIIGAELTTNDCQAAILVDVQGAELRTETLEIYIEDYATSGIFSPDPDGWVTRYLRPDPASTAGFYMFETVFGLYGAPLPFVPSLVMSYRLRNESTQNQATISAMVRAINIVDKTLYIQSIRRLLDANASLNIDPAFLAVGPAQFMEKRT